MLRGLKTLSPTQRGVVVILIIVGVILGLVGITTLLISVSINSGARTIALALLPEYSVRQFAALPDDDAYPPTVAAAPDGTVYTGSFASGAVWAITPEGNTREIPGTREAIGAVSGIAVAGDGSLFIVDAGDTDPRTIGGRIFQVTLPGTVRPFAAIDDERGFIAPNDIAIDSARRVYVSDPGRNEVWRWEADGSGGAVWWVPPLEEGERRASTVGLALDANSNSLLITDPELDKIYRAPLEGGTTELLYRHGDRSNPPGFDGITVAPDGTIYVAALAQNGIAIVNDNDLDYIVGNFRGSSDVEFASPNRLYVTNFDQASIVVPLRRPQLPFALDVIEITP